MLRNTEISKVLDERERKGLRSEQWWILNVSDRDRTIFKHNVIMNLFAVARNRFGVRLMYISRNPFDFLFRTGLNMVHKGCPNVSTRMLWLPVLRGAVGEVIKRRTDAWRSCRVSSRSMARHPAVASEVVGRQSEGCEQRDHRSTIRRRVWSAKSTYIMLGLQLRSPSEFWRIIDVHHARTSITVTVWVLEERCRVDIPQLDHIWNRRRRISL